MAWLITIISQRGNTTYYFIFLPRFITRRIKNQNEHATQSYYLKYNKKYKISKKSENWIFYETKKKRFIVRSLHREHSMLYAEMTFISCKQSQKTMAGRTFLAYIFGRCEFLWKLNFYILYELKIWSSESSS